MSAEMIIESLDLRQFLAGADAAADHENGFDLDDVLTIEEAWELEETSS